MKKKNKLIIKELKDILQRNFQDISKVILFGSQATGKAFGFSDYDILVIVNHPISWKERREISDKIYSIDLKYNILTDVKIISEPELDTIKGKQPFIRQALQNGVVA